MNLLILAIILGYGLYSGDMWPAIVAFIVFALDEGFARFRLPPSEEKLTQIKADIDEMKLELNSIKFRSMK